MLYLFLVIVCLFLVYIEGGGGVRCTTYVRYALAHFFVLLPLRMVVIVIALSSQSNILASSTSRSSTSRSSTSMSSKKQGQIGDITIQFFSSIEHRSREVLVLVLYKLVTVKSGTLNFNY